MSFSRMMVATLAALLLIAPGDARADLALSTLVLELAPTTQTRADVEVWNSGSESSYVTVEPREILGAGTADEFRRKDPDPEKLGLLVAPARMVLEPGERRLLRVANFAPTSDRERVYRVTVAPVVAGLSSPSSGLKILVGYEVLVLVRPASFRMDVSSRRAGNQLILRNDGNVSVELVNGSDCDSGGQQCRPLAGGRLYVGAEKTVDISAERRAEYTLKAGKEVFRKFFR